MTARAGNRRYWLISALRSHTKAPYKIDSLREPLRPREHPGRARTLRRRLVDAAAALRLGEHAVLRERRREPLRGARGHVNRDRTKPAFDTKMQIALLATSVLVLHSYEVPGTSALVSPPVYLSH
jgi:hypothetical protein